MFEAAIKKGPCIIDFTASWCGPCQQIGPVFEGLASEFPALAFYKVDVDKNREVAAANNVSAMPTFKVFEKGSAVEEMRGADPNGLRQLVDEAVTRTTTANQQLNKS